MLIHWICAPTHRIQVGLGAFDVNQLLQAMSPYTGHSLGAGVAAMLSLKMHQRAQGVKCWAFCPPGGLLSQNLSHAAEDYCTSIIVNKDMVPRLSLKTVCRLFEGMFFCLIMPQIELCTMYNAQAVVIIISPCPSTLTKLQNMLMPVTAFVMHL